MQFLFKLFTTKLTLDGFEYKTEKSDSGFRVIISRCPWYDLMANSERESLAEKVGTLICSTEYSGWASEFGDDICFQLERQICKGSEFCILHFNR